MKTTLLSFSCFLFILFFTLTIHHSTAEEVDCDKFLCDDDWNFVKAGKPYHFGPPKGGGGIVLEGVPKNGVDKPCPRFGLMLQDRHDLGDYFTFTPVVPNDAGLVPLETPFAIASAENACNDTGILRMSHTDKRYKFWHVTAKGVFNTKASCFEFIKYPAPTVFDTPTYLLQNCPYKCGNGTGECFQVGNLTVSNGLYEDYFLTTENYTYPMEFNLRSPKPEENNCDKFLCDDDRNLVKAGEPYHFGPLSGGGGVVLDGVPMNGIDKPCPRFGLMLRDKNDLGDYFTFTPIVPNAAGLVPLATPFAIASAEKPACDDTGTLRMTHRDERYQFWHVTADGIFNTGASCFEFINYSGPTTFQTPMYLLQNCPYKCGEGSAKCYKVGNLSVPNGFYFLTTENNPDPVVFYLSSLKLEYKSVSV